MSSSSSIPVASAAPPIFDGKNYQVWVLKMESYLKEQLLWDAVTTDYVVEPPTNQTPALIKQYEERWSRKFRALNILQTSLTETVFSRVMACETAKEIWDKLKLEYQGSNKSKQMEILNLRKDFELLHMKESESIDEYLDRVSVRVNKLKLLGVDMPDRRVVEKVLVTLPERFESKISSIEDSYDMTTLSLSELTNSLHAVERRRQYRKTASSSEAALIASTKGKEIADETGKDSQKQKKGKSLVL